MAIQNNLVKLVDLGLAVPIENERTPINYVSNHFILGCFLTTQTQFESHYPGSSLLLPPPPPGSESSSVPVLPFHSLALFDSFDIIESTKILPSDYHPSSSLPRDLLLAHHRVYSPPEPFLPHPSTLLSEALPPSSESETVDSHPPFQGKIYMTDLLVDYHAIAGTEDCAVVLKLCLLDHNGKTSIHLVQIRSVPDIEGLYSVHELLPTFNLSHNLVGNFHPQGTDQYIPPEASLLNRDSVQGDIFSAGVVLCQLMTHANYSDFHSSLMSVDFDLLSCYRTYYQTRMSFECFSLIHRMTTHLPHRLPNCEAVLRSDWLTQPPDRALNEEYFNSLDYYTKKRKFRQHFFEKLNEGREKKRLVRNIVGESARLPSTSEDIKLLKTEFLKVCPPHDRTQLDLSPRLGRVPSQNLSTILSPHSKSTSSISSSIDDEESVPTPRSRSLTFMPPQPTVSEAEQRPLHLGSLTEDSFMHIMQTAGFPELMNSEVFKIFDWDGENGVDYKEFLLTCVGLAISEDQFPTTPKDIQVSNLYFDIMDLDGNEELSREEMASILPQIVGSRSPNTLNSQEEIEFPLSFFDKVFTEMDRDNNASIDRSEFNSYYEDFMRQNTRTSLSRSFTNQATSTMAASPTQAENFNRRTLTRHPYTKRTS